MAAVQHSNRAASPSRLFRIVIASAARVLCGRSAASVGAAVLCIVALASLLGKQRPAVTHSAREGAGGTPLLRPVALAPSTPRADGDGGATSAAAPVSMQRQAPAAASASSSSHHSEIPAFVIICGHGETDTVEEMQTLMKSMMLLASSPFRIVFVTDREGAANIENGVVPKLAGRRTHVANVDVRTVSSFRDAEAYAANLKLELYESHHSGAWGMLKVFLPWLLHDYDRFVILDTDLVFVQDPILLWAEFEKFDNQLYAMPLHTFDASENICSCVVLMRAKRIRESNVYPDLIGGALEEAEPSYWHERTGKYRPQHGDQSVYFQLFKKHGGLVLDLDAKWNRDRCHRYFGAFDEATGVEAGILHSNCDFDPKPWEESPGYFFFEMYKRYMYSWLPLEENDSFSFQVVNSTWLPLSSDNNSTRR